MARPLRIEFAGAHYHLTARGDRQEDIFVDDRDREAFLDLLGEVCRRFEWTIHAWCLMSNHYHLVAETAHPNLSRGMRQLNGVYTQRFNRRHSRVGHVFQGRYTAILVQEETYLMELCRYVVLNPVRAGMVRQPGAWPWSSHRAMIGRSSTPAWLDADGVLARFGRDRAAAIGAWREFVTAGRASPSPWEKLRHQIYLGDDDFIARVTPPEAESDRQEVPRAQRRALTEPLAWYRDRYPVRDDAMARAYLSGAYTMKEIAEAFGVHYMTVSRAVKKFEARTADVRM